jgi:DNA-binding response OmpR family regulator
MRVLIVEDEREMAQVLKVGLEEENHLVSLAFDGVSGLDWFCIRLSTKGC